MDICGIGNALMDVVAFVDESFAPKLGFHNNTVSHLPRARLDAVLAELADASVSAGGGASNAVRTAACLGARATFAGMVGEDEFGRRCAEELRDSGVEPLLRRSDERTGVFCALLAPGGGRTLLVAPGAAADLTLVSPPEALFRRGAVFFVECFLLADRPFFMDCMRRASEAGMTRVLDLSSRGIAAANREFLLAMLPDYCDILFANEDEFVALTDLPLREGLELFSQWNMEVVLKRAELGAVWAGSGRILSSPVRALGPVDETGAGDAFAGAFLYGRSLGLPPERCLRLGNRIAGELLRVPGFGIDPEQLRASASALL